MVLLMLISGLLLAFGAAVANADFSDVLAESEHAAAIESLVSQGILEGYEDGSFKPDQEVNRAEALKIILMGMGASVDETSVAGLVFSDVDESDWFFGYVGSGVSLGIVKGYENGSFKPEQTVNRAEAVKMLLLAGNVEAGSVSSEPFSDVSTDQWYSAYASYSKSMNIVPPQTDGLWHGEEAMTRGEIAELVYRLQIVLEQNSGFDETTNWQRIDFSTVDATMKVPFGWGMKREGVGAVFLLDRENGQVSLLDPFENGASLLMTRYANAEVQSKNALFSTIQAHTGLATNAGKVGAYDALIIDHEGEVAYKEWYIYLPNGRLDHFVASRGTGEYATYLEDILDLIVDSVEFSAAEDLSTEAAVEALRGAIQVDGVGSQMMDYLKDWELIETDAIGVGTGPVDYYYSPSADITIKYERSYDVILDLKEGETSAF